MEDSLRLFLAGYLLLLAVAAIWGQHRNLLLFPGRVLYSLIRVTVFIISFGRVRITPRVRRTVLRGRRARRSLRRALADIREERIEETPGKWLSSRDKSEAPPTSGSHSGGR